MARNRVVLSVLGGLVVAGVAFLLVLRGAGAEGSDADGAVAVLQQQRAAAPAVERAPLLSGATPAAAPAALPASFAPEAPAPGADAHALPESYRRALGALTGRVLEADGAPVAGMTVELLGGRKSMVALPRDALLSEGGLDVNPVVGQAVTGEDGRFRLTDLEPRTFGGLVLDPSGPRAVLRLLDVSPSSGQERDLGDIVLVATATLKGNIIDDRGAPLAGVRVRATQVPMAGMPGMESVIGAIADFRGGGAVLVPAGTETLQHDIIIAPPASLTRLEKHLPIPTTYTDAAGAFVLSGVVPGIALFAADDGVHLPLVKDSVPTGGAGGERDLGKLAMADGRTLHGRMMNDRNEPLAGAEVLAGNPLGIVPASVLKGPVRTGPDGRFTVPGLREGLVWTAARTDRRQEFTAFSSDDLSREITFTLPAPRTLRVTVTDEKGAPLTGARLFGRQVEDRHTPDFLVPPRPLDAQVSTSKEEPGLYVLADLAPSTWELAVSVRGYGTERAEADLSGGDTSVQVILPAGRGVVVRVVRASDHHTPVEHAFVAAFQSDDDSPDTGARTDARGIAHLADLRRGEVRLQVTHPALAIAERTASVSGPEVGEMDEVLVELQSGSTILGSVLENGGPPAEPLMVMFEAHDATGDAELPRATVTDADGNFRFDQVEPGSVNLEARSRSDLQSGGLSIFETFFNSPLAETKVDIPVAGEVQATLVVGAALADTDTGWLGGTLAVNGRAAEGWKVRTFGRIRRTASVDAAGHFDLGRIEAGEVVLSASPPGASLMDGMGHNKVVTLAKDEHKLVDMAFSTGGVRGKVSSAADGRPLAGVKVRAAAGSDEGTWFGQASAVTGPDGSFQIDTVAAGEYRLTASTDGYANATGQAFRVTEMQVVSAPELRLAAALRAEGVLSVSGDAKPTWMWLVATSADGTTRDTAQVDRKTGAFSFDGLAPGSWTLTLATDLDGEFAPLTMSFDHDVTGLKLVFDPAPEEPAENAETAGDDAQGKVVTFEVK